MEYEYIWLKYSPQNHILAKKVEGFFRLAGLFVCSRCRGTRQYYYNDIKYEEEQNMPVCDIDVILDYTEANTWQSILDAFLENLKKKNFPYIDSFYILRPLYTEEIAQATATLEFFKTADQLVYDAGESFRILAETIEAKREADVSLKEDQFVTFAQYYCLWQVNNARIQCNERVIQFGDEMAAQVYRDIKCFEQGQINYPCIYLIACMRGNRGEASLMKAEELKYIIERSNATPYRGIVWLEWGKVFAISVSSKYDILSATKAYERMQTEQAIFAKIRAMEKEVKVDELKKQPRYEEIVNKIKEHEKNMLEKYLEALKVIEKHEGFLNPLEQQNYFITLLQIGKRLIDQKKPEESVSYLETAENLYDSYKNMDKESLYIKAYYELYGEENAPKYIQLKAKQLQINQVYIYLTKAYGLLYFDEKAAYYRKKTREIL